MANDSDTVSINLITSTNAMTSDVINVSLSHLSVNSTTLNDNIWQLTMGSVVFVLIWPQLYFVFSFLPLGPLATSLLGATLMVLCQTLSEDELYVVLSDRTIASAVICVAAAMMFGLYAVRLGLVNAILRRTLKPESLTLSYLWRMSLLSFLASGLFNVDATTTIIVPRILKVWKDQDRPSVELETLLLALSTSANLGSVLTVWGSIHTALLAVKTSAMYSYGLPIVYHQRNCAIYLVPAALLGWTINVIFLMVHYLIRKRRTHRLASASPSSHGQAETPTSSQTTDISTLNAGKKKTSNGYVNAATVESPVKESELVHLTDTSGAESSSSPSKPHTLETIDEDLELTIVNPTPLLRHPHNVVKSAPVACAELLEDFDEEEESEFEKGERMAAEELNDLDIVSTYRPLVPGRDTPSTSGGVKNVDSSSGNLGSMRQKFQPLADLNIVSEDSVRNENVNSEREGTGDLGSMRKKFSAALDLNSLENDSEDIATTSGYRNYKPGALSRFRGGDMSENDHQLLVTERQSNTPSNGSLRRHSADSADSKKPRRLATEKAATASYGIPMGSSSTPLLYWSLTNVSMAELLFECDVAVSYSNSHGKKGCGRGVCFTLTYVLCYVTMVTSFVAAGLSSVVHIDMGVVTLVAVVTIAALLACDALVNRQDVQHLFSRHVNWSSLVLFACLAVWLAGFAKTGIAAYLWSHWTIWRDGQDITSYAQLALTVLLITSACYMLGAPVATLLLLANATTEFQEPSESALEFALLLAWCGALVGNLTPSASAAPLLTANAGVKVADRAAPCVYLSYWTQLAFTLPTTAVVLTVGVVVIHCLIVLF